MHMGQERRENSTGRRWLRRSLLASATTASRMLSQLRWRSTPRFGARRFREDVGGWRLDCREDLEVCGVFYGLD